MTVSEENGKGTTGKDILYLRVPRNLSVTTNENKMIEETVSLEVEDEKQYLYEITGHSTRATSFPLLVSGDEDNDVRMNPCHHV